MSNDAKGVFNDLVQQTQLQIDITAKLNKTLDDLQIKQREMSGSWKKYTQEFDDGSKAINATTDALKNANALIAKNTEILKLAQGSLQQNKQLLADLQEKYEKLSSSQGNNSKEVYALNRQIGNLSVTIGEQEKKVEKAREVFDAHTESVEALKTAFDKIKSSNKDFGPILEDVTKGFNAMKTGISAVKTGFDSVGGAIKTTGFGLLVLVLQSLVEYFTNTTEGTKKLHGAMAVIGKIVEVVNAAV